MKIDNDHWCVPPYPTHRHNNFIMKNWPINKSCLQKSLNNEKIRKYFFQILFFFTFGVRVCVTLSEKFEIFRNADYSFWRLKEIVDKKGWKIDQHWKYFEYSLNSQTGLRSILICCLFHILSWDLRCRQIKWDF